MEDWNRIGWNDPDPVKRAEYATLNKNSLKVFAQKQIVLFAFVMAYLFYARATNEWTPEHLQHDLDTMPDRWTSIWYLHSRMAVQYLSMLHRLTCAFWLCRVVVCRQIGAGLFIFETIFYWCVAPSPSLLCCPASLADTACGGWCGAVWCRGHRVQHWYFYQYHKIHHEYNIPNVLTAAWGSDVDGCLTLVLPGFVPAVLFGYHLYTFMMWTIIHFAHTYLGTPPPLHHTLNCWMHSHTFMLCVV